MSVAVENCSEKEVAKKRKRIRKSKSRTGPESQVVAIEIANEEESTATIVENDKAGKFNCSAEDDMDDAKDNKTKRKRKRTRNKSAKETIEVAIGGKSEALPSTKDIEEFTSRLKALDLSYGNQAVDERTSNALIYAKQYHLDRSNWKFNKAKQEYLIRHLFHRPTAPISISQVKNIQANPTTESEKAKDENETASNYPFLPEEWLECIGRYLSTIQGQAKQRVIDMLEAKARLEIVSPPESTTIAIESSLNATPTLDVDLKKGISFGDLAMMHQDARADVSPISIDEWHRLRFEKDRASKILQFMSK